MASGQGQGMRHGVRMGNGTLRAREKGLREPRGQGAATLPLLIGPVQGTSCPFCPAGLGSLMELSLGMREEHPCSAPGSSRPRYTEEVVAPIMEMVPRPTCLQCPALSWAGELAPMDFALPCAHLHLAPCSGGLASPAGAAWPQLRRPAAAPCLPPSAVHGTIVADSPHHSPRGAGTPEAQPHRLSRDVWPGWTCSLAST